MFNRHWKSVLDTGSTSLSNKTSYSLELPVELRRGRMQFMRDAGSTLDTASNMSNLREPSLRPAGGRQDLTVSGGINADLVPSSADPQPQSPRPPLVLTS